MDNLGVEITEISHIKLAIKDRITQIANNVSNCRLEHVEYELESVMAALTQLCYYTDVSSILDKVKRSYDIILRENSSSTAADRSKLHTPGLVYTSQKGRPCYNIHEDTLLYFIENGFTIKNMALLLSVSEKTIVNRLSDYGLSIRGSYCSIGDEELERIVSAKVAEFPTIGYKSMLGHLKSDGIKITHTRLRRVMRTVDPLGVLMRNVFCQTYRIRRRSYSVRAPMALWHIDTNHKLIRWRFVFHGGIDGYSRLPVYLKVASDNTSSTAFASFTTGIQQYGIPERVRTDKGLENVKIAEFMLTNHGANSKSHITGRSVHNQRIERFWRELWQGCTCTYYHLFRKMEQDGILDVDNEIHIVVLHLVYLNRIQSSVDRFVHAVSRRPLRTEHNKTPLQLWIMGQILDPRAQISEQEIDTYGIDYCIPDLVFNDDQESIVVPELQQIPVGVIAEANVILQQPVECPYEVQQYLDICDLIQANNDM